jgi:hypothetical protein
LKGKRPLFIATFSICCLLYPYFSYFEARDPFVVWLSWLGGKITRVLFLYLLPEQGKLDLMSHDIFPFLFDSFRSEIEWGRQMIERIPFVFPAYFTSYLFNSLGKLILFGDWQP